MKTEELHPHFKIRSPLRCDGIGRLDCAEDTESGARLAVRWLPLDANGDAAVRACANLPDHPTLPRVRQTGQVGDKAFLAMEFPDGKLLATMMGEPVSGELLLEMGAQLADALATIHMQQVFHGELSAESVLLAKGKAYLWDMPLVIANRLTDRRGEERLMHQLVRTAPFLPPERARGGVASPEGDVYSLAAVMCLAGGAKMPPKGTTLATVHAIVIGEWAPSVPAMFHQPFRGMLERMLSREPSQRPSAREVADLLGKPAGAIPTIPEMPAIVLPPHLLAGLPAAHRPAPKTPYHAAPGSLEPMLPTRAVADAATKAAALAYKPLAITVPTKVEPTVKVSIPVQVLVAMSQTVSLDAEIKRTLEAHRPVVTSEQIATTKTLEFGMHAPPMPVAEVKREKTPPPFAVPVKEKTPPPAVSPTIAEVKAAIWSAQREKTPPPTLSPSIAEVKAIAAALAKEKTPPPAAAPVVAEVKAALEAPAAAPTAPNPPPMPHRDSREVPPPFSQLVTQPALPPLPEPEVVPPAPPAEDKAAAVELRENIAVSAETFAGGAALLSEDEADALEQLPRSRPTFAIAAVALALLTIGIAVGARALVHKNENAPVKLAPVVTKPAPKVEPVKAVVDADDDELGPLPVSSPKLRYTPRTGTRRAAAAPQAPSRLEGKYDSHGEQPAPPADDFSFLDNSAEAPKEELKRPAF